MLAVICPTTQSRSAIYADFLKNWEAVFAKHNVLLLTIFDGDDQTMQIGNGGAVIDAAELLGKNKDLIYHNDTACKNLGLYYCALHPEIETIIILDDDVAPVGDPIAQHIAVLGQRVPISWVSTASHYMRGFPYGIREEAEIALSHGVWDGVPDLDAPTQLTRGIPADIVYPTMVIPKHSLFPMCGMHLALTRKALPHLYFAPPWQGMSRCDDIFAGILLKRALDQNNLAVATGYARVHHKRASNVYENLKKEALFIQLNESFWSGDTSHPYFAEYLPKAKRWTDLLTPLLTPSQE